MLSDIALLNLSKISKARKPMTFASGFSEDHQFLSQDIDTSGALVYVCGIYFYMNDKKKWFHTIWHIFVIIGSIVHISGLK